MPISSSEGRDGQDLVNSATVTCGRGYGTKWNLKGDTTTKNSVIIAAEWNLTHGE